MMQAPSTRARSASRNRPACVAITGASSGLGAGLARAYAAPGVTLALTGRDPARLDAVAEACRRDGARVEAAVLDVTDAPAMAGWLRRIDGAGPIELLIANAGITAGTRLDGGAEEMEAARAVVQVNLLGAINSIEPLLPLMAARGRGQVALVASMAGYRGLPDTPAYCASKAGVLAYGDALRCAMEPRGVRVSVVVPGFFVSPMSARCEGSQLFLLPQDQAVGRIVRGLERRARRIVFPWQLALMLRFVNILPVWLGDRLVRGFRFRIAASC